MQTNNPYDVTDIASTIASLQRDPVYRKSPGLARFAPLMRAGGLEARVGSSTYIPKAYRYKYNTFGRDLNLNEFMSVKLNELRSDPLAFEHFTETYRQKYIYNQPRSGSLKRASMYQKSGAVMDIDSIETGETLTAWRNRLTSTGIPVSVEDIDQRIFLTKNEADLMPWAGKSQTVRKRTTLLNYNVRGTAKGMSGAASLGMEAPYVTTPQMLDIAQRQSEAYLYKVKNTHVMDRAAELTLGFTNYGKERMVQYSTSARMQGGPFLYKEGITKGEYVFPEKRISLDPSEIKAFRTLGTTGLDWQRASLKSTRAQQIAMLADMGISKTRGRRMVDLLGAMNRGDIFSSRAIGKQREFIYGARESFGPGSKAVVGGAKGLIAEVKTYSGKDKYGRRLKAAGGFVDIAHAAMGEWGNTQELMGAALEQAGGDIHAAKRIFKKATASPDIIAPILTGKETLRHLDIQMQGASLLLTSPKNVPDVKVAMANAERIAQIVNQHAKDSIASTTERTIRLSRGIEITQPMVQDVMNMLSPVQKAQMKLGRMPTIDYSIGTGSKVRFGKHIGLTINDIMGMQIQGMSGIANLYGSKIAKNQWAIASEIQGAYGHLSGRLRGIKGAISVGASDIDRLMGRTDPHRVGKTLHNIQGSMMFDPDQLDQTYMLNLGKKITVDIGGMDRQISEIPLLSKAARGLKMDSSGQIYKTQIDRSYLNLLEAVKTGAGIEKAAQGVVSTMGTFGGKKGFVDRAVAMTKIEGLSGTMHFISPEAEAALTAKYGEHGGFVGLTMEQAKKIYSGYSSEEVTKAFDEGVYFPLKREPAAPRGIAIGRGFLINDELKAMANFGPNGIAISPGIGAHVHGDLDNDTAFVESEWALQAQSNPELKAMFRDGYLKELHRFAGFENEVVNKLRKNDKYNNFIEDAQSRLTPEAGLGEVAAIAQAKKELTGKAYIKGAQAYHGAVALGNLPGYERFNQARAADVSQVLFGIAESGINAKRGGKVLQADELEEMFRQKDVTGFAEGSKDVMSSIFGEDLPEHERLSLAADAIEATNFGASREEGYNKYRKLISGSPEYRATGVSQIADALFQNQGVAGTPSGQMTGSAIFKSAEQLGASNARMSAEAAIPRNKGFINAAREGIESFGKGLREGRGWTSLAVGAAVLGGLALGMRKPGNMYVTTNSNESQTAPDGTLRTTNEMRPASAPMIMPRRQSSVSVMTDDQYNVKIKLRDARKRDKQQLVDLSQAISGRYKTPSKVQLSINDDTNEVDYQRIFNDQYRKALRGNN